jgi:hypothetical protein
MNFILERYFQVKKELSKASNIYSNNEIYRKENVQSPHVVSGLKGNPGNYNRTNNNQYQSNQYKIKGQSANCQDGYGFQGFYPKHGVPAHSNIPPPPHPNQATEMFTKHEVEFHQKGVVLNNQQSFAQQFHPTSAAAAQKFDSHDFEHPTMIKAGDLNQKVQGNNVHARPTDFQQNQMYYNENSTTNPHHNQYYPNEFDVGNDSATTGGGYFDPKQQHYYEMNYHHQHGSGGNDYSSEMYGPNNSIINENCENFSTFQQYYEHQQQQQQQHQAHQQQQNMHPHYHVPSGYHQQNFNNSNPQMHANNAGNLDNSNSSSDFNFLSNLNDFAPEYYQLS